MVNKVILLGKVGKDPEFLITAKSSVAKFSLATSKKIGKGENKKDQTQWHNLVAFGNKAVFANDHIRKGMTLYIEGELSYSKYENKQGQMVYKTDIIVNTFEIGGSKQEGRNTNDSFGGENLSESAANDAYFNNADEIPF